MSADLMKRAAEKLRTALAADYLTDGPWECLDGGDRIVHIEPPTGAMECVVDEPMSNPSNAEYIALMHPPVAEAMARLLDRIREVASGPGLPPSILGCADVVAEAIVREERSDG